MIIIKEQNIKIFLFDLNLLYGYFNVNENTIGLLRTFIEENFNKDTAYFFNLVLNITIIDNELCIDINPSILERLNEEVQTGNIYDIFDQVDLETSNDIAVLAYSYMIHINSRINEFTNEDDKVIKLLQ